MYINIYKYIIKCIHICNIHKHIYAFINLTRVCRTKYIIFADLENTERDYCSTSGKNWWELELERWKKKQEELSVFQRCLGGVEADMLVKQ